MKQFRPVAAVAGAIAVLACLAPQAQTPPRAPVSFDLTEATVADLQARMERGQETARSLVEKYLARIEAIDREGPSLGSVLELNPDALAIADRLDAERQRTGARGPLHGIPILIKDNIATADRMTTTAGSLALRGVHAPEDAFVVGRLRNAGAVILGKTNLSEWANFRSTRSSSGWSARGGQTKNPYALDRSPLGSSSGSAVAAAASLAAAAVGTETYGSIVSPSSANGVVGIKPTVGLLGRTGIVPIASSQDTAGPIARTVADAALLLGAMVSVDPNDPSTRDGVRRGRRDYSVFLDPAGLRGARIGVVRKKLFGYSAAADRLADRAIAEMERRGAVIIDPADIPTLDALRDSQFTVLLYEFKAGLNQFLAWLGPAAPVASLAEVIAFNEAHKDEELRYFGQDLLIRAQATDGLASPEYRRARETSRRLARALGIDAVMTKHKLDALVAPTFGPAWLIDLTNGDSPPPQATSPALVAAVAGYPHITVPMGYHGGLPIGISFFGRAWSEPVLLKLAYAYEQATRHRRPPGFAPTAISNER